MKVNSLKHRTILAATTLGMVCALCPVWAHASASSPEETGQQLEETAANVEDQLADPQVDALAEAEVAQDAQATESEPATTPDATEDLAEEPAGAADSSGTESTDPATAADPEPDIPATVSYFGDEVVIPNGIYIISSAANGSQVLDVASGTTANGGAIQLHTANSTPAQRFRITRNASTGIYTIINVNSSLALDVKGASRVRGAAIQQWKSNNSVAQQWRMYDAGDGAIYLVSQLSGENGASLVLDIPNGKAVSGAKMRTWTANGSVAQRFKLTKVERSVDDGVYEVVSQLDSNLLLDVYLASRSNGGNVWTWSRNNSPAQWWRVKYNSATGFYQLINCNSEKALDLVNSGYANGTNIQIYTAKAGHKAQTWSIEKNAGGGYVLRSAISGKAVDIANGQKKPGANVRLWNANGSAAQGWSFKAPTMASVASGAYQIVSLNNMVLGLDVAGASTANGANVRLWTLNDSNAQKWKVGEADSSGWRVIIAAHSGTYLSTNSSGNICLSTGMSGDSEKWKVVASTLGYELVNKATGKVADVAGGNIAKGTNVRAYKANNSAAQRFVLVKTTVKAPNITSGIFIMGKSEVTQVQAVRYLNTYFSSRGISLPSKWVKDGETIEKLVKYFYEEGEAEGVRGDVALAQSIHETGYFQFGNLVQPEQYNFAGIGATGPGHPGNTFASARIGIRAQIQHLKAYASTEPLKQAVVDPRFSYVDRGCAPTVESLGGKWAVPGVGYGQMIVDIMNAMRA